VSEEKGDIVAIGNTWRVRHVVKTSALWTSKYGKEKTMRRLIVAAMVMTMLLISVPLFAAEESTPPPQPEPKAVVPAHGKRSGTPMSPAASMGMLGATPKSAAASASQEPVLYPMFQVLGPSMTGNTGLSPEAMDTLLTMQGEMMIKMGEMLMKYGQIMPRKAN
jgi:hypothetical protein